MRGAKTRAKEHLMTVDHPLKQYVETTPDWPKEGVNFLDISPLLADHFNETVQAMQNLFTADELDGIDAFAGLDARGFIFAAALATATGKGFIMPRKGGKLPPPFSEKSYDLEYGQATLQLKPGNGNVAIVDDVLATGGTLKAAAELCSDAGYTVKSLAVLIDLAFLHDDDFNWQGITPRAVMTYE